MTRIIKVLSAVALAAIGQTLFAYNGGYENSLTNDTVIGGVTYKGYGNNTVTKRTESGTTIAANSYAQCSKLTSVNLAGVTSLGNAAFAYSALTSVELPATLKSIGYIPFGGCKSLASVTINSTAFMTSANEAKEPFRDCTALKTVTAKCAPPSWDFKKVFPAVTTVKVPQANLSAWQAKKYAGVTIALSESTYTVRYNKNDGSGAVITKTYTAGASLSLPWINSSSGLGWANPSGWTIIGWAKSASATTAEYANGAKVPALGTAGQTVDLYVVWKKPAPNAYIVRFNRNDGSGQTAEQSITCGTAQGLKWKDSGLGWTTAPAGKTFLGWGAAANATVVKWANGATVTDLAAAGKTVDLYAVWRPSNAYVVTFHRNLSGGDAVTASQWISRGVTTSLAWKDSGLGWAAPAGYAFVGWAESASGAKKYDNGAKVTDLAVAGKTVDLYAVWQKQPYTVKFHRNNGTSETKTQTFAVGAEVQLPWKDSAFGWANPSGKTFLGWGTSAGSVAFYANGEKVKDLAASGATVDLYAIWRPASSYIVKFHRNTADGDAVTASQWLATGTASLAWKDSQLMWANPSGWTFLGWSKSKGATTATYVNGAKVTDLAAKGGTVDLYAVWKRPTYTVRFFRNAGGGETDTRTFEVGRTVSLPWVNGGLGWANPSGKSPLGWATSATATIAVYENGGKVKDLAAAGKTVDLHMIWRSSSTYTVRYHRNYDGADTVIALQAQSSSTLKLAWKDSALGWANPSGRTFLGWATTASATKAGYVNGGTATVSAKANAVFDFYAVWSGGASKSAPAPQAAFQAVPSASSWTGAAKETVPEVFEPGYYRGEFADGSGTFDLVVDEDGAAFFRTETEDGDWSAECEAEAVGDALVLTFEDVAPLVIRCVEGQCWAEAAERCP